jgi:hypothetical protein
MNYQSFSFLIFLVLLYSFWNFNSNVDYNPFGNNTNISIQTLLDDDCELLSAPCGYNTYGKEVAGHIIYYQFNPNEKHKVCAKGICIHIDSTEIQSDLRLPLPFSKEQGFIKELLLEEVDSSRILVPLSKFGVRNIPYQEMKIDSSQFFNVYLEEINTGLNSLEQTWCFIDQDEQTYSATIDFKSERNSQNNFIIIRTLELFISQR